MVTFGKNTSTQIPTTHRIVSTRAQDGVMLFTTKGDANNAPDGAEIRQSDIHGRVLFNISNLGYVIDFIRKPLGMVLIILLPAIFIIYDEVRKIIEEMKKIMAKKKEGDIIIKENV
jgi:signal peptidase